MKTLALLTPHFLAGLTPKAKEYTIHDAGCDGLALRVQPTGGKSWVTWHRQNGKTRRITLGHFPDVSLEQARKARWAIMAADGTLPSSLAHSRTISFAKLVEHFLRAKRDVYRPRTLSCLKVYLNSQLLPAFGHRSVGQITTQELAAWFHTYSRTRPGGANQALGHFGTILNWGKANGHLPEDLLNPVTAIRRNRRQARGRMLSSAQLASLGTVLTAAPPPYRQGAAALMLIILTGCRLGEILSLRWRDVKPDHLALPRAKTGPRDVWLNELAKEVLQNLRAQKTGPRVFPEPTDPSKHMTVISYWPYLRSAAGLPDDIRIHDLRHTYASHAILAGESLPITGALIGHKSTKSTARYAHLDPGLILKAARDVQKQIGEWLEG